MKLFSINGLLVSPKAFFFITTVSVFIAQCRVENEAPFMERIQPVPKDSGFKMNGYWVWGGSLIRVGDLYHLFCSRWPKGNDFPKDYLTKSEIVRATSKSPLGPFDFQEIVIGERDNRYWDSNMAHNPTIHKVDDQFVLFYIGSSFKKRNKGWPPYHRAIGYAVAHSISGPWLRSEKPIVQQESNNPAAYFEKNGSVKLVFRDASLKIFLATAEQFSGPYEIKNDDVWPESRLEDFYLFRHRDRYHLICEDNAGGISGHERWGIQLVSENGIDHWEKRMPTVVYTHDIAYEDGTILHCRRRERPQLLIQESRVTHLITAVYDGENSWCQPVELKPAF